MTVLELLSGNSQRDFNAEVSSFHKSAIKPMQTKRLKSQD